MSLGPEGRESISALFLYYEGALAEGGGGVQLCTREYVNALKAAGFELKLIQVKNDRRFRSRVQRKLNPLPYTKEYCEHNVLADIAKVIDAGVRFVFLNQTVLRPIARALRAHLPNNCRIVLMSHGLRSVDQLHELRASANLRIAPIRQDGLLKMARQLVTESECSQYFDHIFCMNPIEVEIERWLGARSISWLPRTINAASLPWNPREGRIGYVGTLDHPPNLSGFMRFASAVAKLSPAKLSLRLVGRPKTVGEKISRQFSFVDYLGPLSDEALSVEASTWCCFVNPIFDFVMGASMKLSVAIGWEIPIATTAAGQRGYSWNEGNIPTADTPDSLARLALRLSELKTSGEARTEISKVRRSTPTSSGIGLMIREALLRDSANCNS